VESAEVVEVLPFLELVIEQLGVIDYGASEHAMELLLVDAMGPFYFAVESRSCWADVDMSDASG
jgi:hypothetical protein